MNHDQLSFLNPNYFHGCHPLNLRSYFESDPFFENLDCAFPLNLAKTVAPPAKPTYRQQVLKRLLANISCHDLVSKPYVEKYLRDQYRRNCRPNTLRLTATSLTQFLTFLHQLGNTHLELMQRQDIEAFVAREASRYGKSLSQPDRMELGQAISEQPPVLDGARGGLDVMLWSLKMRWWVGSVTDDQDDIEPDVSIFVRYHQADDVFVLENSVGVQKGMFGIVNAYTGRRHTGRNNVIIAHEFFHTLGASDKYQPGTGQPTAPDGLAEPDRSPLFPQRFAEIMGGRIALAPNDAVIPQSLKFAVIGPLTATEIRLSN